MSKTNREVLVENIKDHISTQNWDYRTTLKKRKIDYINSLATFVDNHTVEGTSKNGAKTIYTANRIAIAVGMRPIYPEIPGIEYAISSDDLFYLKKAPGKTLIVGGSYVQNFQKKKIS